MFFLAEPRSLLSRGDDASERLISLRGLRPFEERAESPPVFRVSYRPFAGRGPCGRPHPGREIGYPAMADGHKGRALQEDRNVRLIIKGSIGSQYKSDEVKGVVYDTYEWEL